MANLSKLYNILNETCDLLDDLIKLEDEKLAVVSTREIAALENFMKEEQVFILKLKGLDRKREQVQAELGYTGLTFSEIIAQVTDEDEQIKLKALYDNMDNKTQLIKSTTGSIKRYLDLHIHSVELLLSQLENRSTASGTIYSKTGESTSPTPPRFTSKKV